MKRKASDALEAPNESGVQIGESFMLDAQDAAEEGVYIRGSSCLPVVESLPDDHSGVPADGLEYLFLVRQEAASRPRVKVAPANPYAVDQDAAGPSAPTAAPLLPGRPSEAWKDAFLRKFSTMQQTFGPSNLEAPNTLEDHYYPLPGKDEPAWKSYIHGRTTNPKAAQSTEEASADAAEQEQAKQEVFRLKAQAKQPTRDLVKHIDRSLHMELISYFNEWMEASLETSFPSTMLLPRAMRKAAGSSSQSSSPTPRSEVLSAFTSSWLLALLASLDPLLDAQDISSLRSLAKTCLRVVKELPATAASGSQQVKESVKEQQARAWMVVAIISSVWGQKDLWGL